MAVLTWARERLLRIAEENNQLAVCLLALPDDVAHALSENIEAHDSAEDLTKRMQTDASYAQCDPDALETAAKFFITAAAKARTEAIQAWLLANVIAPPFEAIARVVVTTSTGIGAPGVAYLDDKNLATGQCVFISNARLRACRARGELIGGEIRNWEDIAVTGPACSEDVDLWRATMAEKQRRSHAARLEAHRAAARDAYKALVVRHLSASVSLPTSQLETLLSGVIGELQLTPAGAASSAAAEVDALLRLLRSRAADAAFEDSPEDMD